MGSTGPAELLINFIQGVIIYFLHAYLIFREEDVKTTRELTTKILGKRGGSIDPAVEMKLKPAHGRYRCIHS